jgi:hypothetical protein
MKTIEDQQKRKENTRPAHHFSGFSSREKVIFVRLSFSTSGLRRVEHKVIQLEMKMRSSWSPQKNFHNFFFCYQ